MRAFLCLTLLAALVSWSGMAQAETPKSWAFELKFGPYLPHVDEEFGDTRGRPFRQIFGDSDRLMTMLELDYQFLTWPGSLSVGGNIGYSQMVGRGILARTGERSDDTTVLNVLPLGLSLIYRFDLLVEYSIPIVPFVKGGFDYYIWWCTDGVGDTSVYNNPESREEEDGYGGIWGYHFSFGGQFLLDILDPSTAKTFDVEVGVNHTYLFFEYTIALINTFHQGGMDLSDNTFTIGLVLEL